MFLKEIYFLLLQSICGKNMDKLQYSDQLEDFFRNSSDHYLHWFDESLMHPPQILDISFEKEKLFWQKDSVSLKPDEKQNLFMSFLVEQEAKQGEQKMEKNFEQLFMQKEKLDKEEKISASPQTQANKATYEVQKKLTPFVLEKSCQRKCHCKQSKCLKRYCDCFSNGRYCGDNCGCVNCQNKVQFKEKRQEKIKELIEQDGIVIGQENYSGCQCKKNGCLKKYCVCFSLGISCGKYCSCINCENGCSDKRRKKETKKRKPKSKF